MHVRDIDDDDVDVVAALLVRAYQEHLDRFPPGVSESYRAELLDVASRRATCDVLVADDDGLVTGTVTLVRDARDDGHPWPPGGCVLRLLAVDPGARRRGTATALTAACIARARARGVTYVGLHTAPVMQDAQRIYERAGFRRASEHDFDPDLYYGGDAGGGDAPWGLAYVLRLDH